MGPGKNRKAVTSTKSSHALGTSTKSYRSPLSRYSAFLNRAGNMADKGAYLPSPEEIKAATLVIQEGWSEADWASRCVLPQAGPVEFRPIKMLRSVRHLLGDRS